ncbi:sensor histidine kinase [Saccharothrix sp. 6-C]|uniref:sensor histidine kinase n=1 Tax=Saccharothrix sp. 6-C TaxID=2781735 RepID=UPI001F1C8B25|nr:sensor histidine kinase [Saccharothrix sp. 6-C]
MFPRAARGLAHLLAGLVIGPASFVWAVVTTLATGLLSFTYLGPPVFLVVTWVSRRIARVERWRAGWVLRRPIGDPYGPLTGRNPWTRGRAVIREPGTWRDLAWLLAGFPVGLVTGVAGVVAGLVWLGTVLAPLWLWAVPNPRLYPVADWLFNTVGGRFTLAAAGLAAAWPVWWLVAALSRVQASVAARLLEAGPRARLRQQVSALRATRLRVVDAQAAELRRIERDLHDGAQARIVAAGMTLALADRKLRASGSAEDPVRADVVSARRQLDEALAELRRLVRGIYPPILTDRGLVSALTALAGDAPSSVVVDAPELGDLPAAVESAAYFVVAEALANAVKHAGADECVITLRRTDGVLTLAVRDDGRGGADPSGSGLDGLRRRVEALDGTMEVTSPPGGPTTVLAEFPCAS